MGQSRKNPAQSSQAHTTNGRVRLSTSFMTFSCQLPLADLQAVRRKKKNHAHFVKQTSP
jgi:hypothetical protein